MEDILDINADQASSFKPGLSWQQRLHQEWKCRGSGNCLSLKNEGTEDVKAPCLDKVYEQARSSKTAFATTGLY
jgi:hypothetical protein